MKENELNDMEISNLPDNKDFKVMLIKILTGIKSGC